MTKGLTLHSEAEGGDLLSLAHPTIWQMRGEAKISRSPKHMQVLRLDHLLPAPQTGTALLWCLGEMQCQHSRVLQLERGRVNCPTPVTLSPAFAA